MPRSSYGRVNVDRRNQQSKQRKSPPEGMVIRVVARNASAQVDCGGMLPTLAWQSCGTGECCWTPLRAKTDMIHRQMRIKIRVEKTRRRKADKLPRNAAALEWPRAKAITEWVNVASRRCGRKQT